MQPPVLFGLSMKDVGKVILGDVQLVVMVVGRLKGLMTFTH